MKKGNASESDRALLEAFNRAYAGSSDPDEVARQRAMRDKQRRLVKEDVEMPLVDCSHEASSGEEVTPERAADALLEEEASWHLDRLR